MKKILTILMLVMLVSAAQAQQQHEKIKELKELLNRHGLELRFKSRHNSVENVVIRKDLGIGYGLWAPRTDSTMTLEEKQRRIHQFDSLNNQRRIEMAAMLDSMKPIVAEMMASASECYLHENHKDGKDTLEYFFCFPHKDSDSMLLAHPNHRPFAAERVQLHFRQGLKQGPYNNWLFESNLYLTYNYYESTQGEMTLLNRNGASWSVKKPHRFDVDGFERFLSQALHPILKKRGVHQYPIHWQFDDTYLTRDFKYDKKEAFFVYDIQKN